MCKYKLIEIDSIEEVTDQEVYVYDLTVDDDSSYVANSYVVHNCITSSNVGIQFSVASLIDETKNQKKIVESIFNTSKDSKFKSVPKIIADGGVRNYSDAIKALALGADYVMIGGLFTRMLESAAITFVEGNDIVGRRYVDNYNIIETENGWEVSDKKDIFNVWAQTYPKLFKSFFGMASKKAQKLMHGQKIRTSEGIEKVVEVKFTLPQWVENFTDYLRSAMSYTNAKTLNDFINNTNTVLLSNNTYNSVNK